MGWADGGGGRGRKVGPGPAFPNQVERKDETFDTIEAASKGLMRVTTFTKKYGEGALEGKATKTILDTLSGENVDTVIVKWEPWMEGDPDIFRWR